MGLFKMSTGASPRLGEPQPHNFKIVQATEIGDNLVAMIDYPNSTEFSGLKILVYKNLSENELRECSILDPHFLEKSDYPVPVARFIPGEEGLKLAFQLAEIIGAESS